MSTENGPPCENRHLLYWLNILANGLTHKNGYLDKLHEPVSTETHGEMNDSSEINDSNDMNDSNRMNDTRGTNDSNPAHKGDALSLSISKGFKKCHRSAKFSCEYNNLSFPFISQRESTIFF